MNISVAIMAILNHHLCKKKFVFSASRNISQALNKKSSSYYLSVKKTTQGKRVALNNFPIF